MTKEATFSYRGFHHAAAKAANARSQRLSSAARAVSFPRSAIQLKFAKAVKLLNRITTNSPLVLRHLPQLLTEEMKAREVPVPIPAGGCLLFHSLNLHYSSPNTSTKRRRAWALHYMMAKTRDLSTDEEVHVDYISVRGKSHAGFV